MEYQRGLNKINDIEEETLSQEIPEDPIDELDNKIKALTKRLDKLELQVKDIDMDVNDLFDDVEGKYEDSNK